MLYQSYGGMAERLNAAVLKTVEVNSLLGFKSLFLRQTLEKPLKKGFFCCFFMFFSPFLVVFVRFFSGFCSKIRFLSVKKVSKNLMSKVPILR